MKINLPVDNALCDKYPFFLHKQALNMIPKSKKDCNDALNVCYIDETDKFIQGYTSEEHCHNIVAHLHCYDMGVFNTIYGEYINHILKDCTFVVVTYTINTSPDKFGVFTKHTILSPIRVRVLRIPNRGMDIGAKILAMHYFARKCVQYKYILFLHSKSNIEMRQMCFRSLVCTLKDVVRGYDDNILGYFPPKIVNGGNGIYTVDADAIDPSFINDIPHTAHINSVWGEMCDFMELDRHITIFPEGNMYILHHAVAAELFQAHAYFLLNSDCSFDMHWVYVYYKLSARCNRFSITSKNVYNYYKVNRLVGNNIERRKMRRKPDHADSQLEHVFERIVFNIIQKRRGKIRIVPHTNGINRVATSSHIHHLEYLNRTINRFIFKHAEAGRPPAIDVSGDNFLPYPLRPDGCPILWINLDSNIGRRECMSSQLPIFKSQHSAKKITRVPAMRGDVPISSQTFLETNAFYTQLCQFFLNHTSRKSIFSCTKMSTAEIGCLMSHLVAMHSFLQMYPDEPYAFILEDDVNLISWESVRRLPQVCKYLNSQSSGYECIQLSGVFAKLPNPNTIKRATKNAALFFDWSDQLNNTNGQHPFWTTGAYIISRKGCHQMLNIIYGSDICDVYPADWFIYLNISTATMYPPLCCSHSHLKSDIRTNTSLQQKSNSMMSSMYFKKRIVFLSTLYFVENIIDTNEDESFTRFIAWSGKVASLANADVFIIGDKLPIEFERHLPDNVIYFYMDYSQFAVYCKRMYAQLNGCVLDISRNTVEFIHPWLIYMFSEYVCVRNYEYFKTFMVWEDLNEVDGLTRVSINHRRFNLTGMHI